MALSPKRELRRDSTRSPQGVFSVWNGSSGCDVEDHGIAACSDHVQYKETLAIAAKVPRGGGNTPSGRETVSTGTATIHESLRCSTTTPLANADGRNFDNQRWLWAILRVRAHREEMSGLRQDTVRRPTAPNLSQSILSLMVAVMVALLLILGSKIAHMPKSQNDSRRTDPTPPTNRQAV